MDVLLQGAVRGKNAARYKAGTNLVRDWAGVSMTARSVYTVSRLDRGLGSLDPSAQGCPHLDRLDRRVAMAHT